MYFYPSPPYVLLIFGLATSVLCGAAFEGTLKEQIRLWSEGHGDGLRSNFGDRSLAESVLKSPLVVPFWGVMIGICVFLAAGIQIFAFSGRNSWIAGGVITVLTARLVWDQLGKVLGEIEKGEFKLMELEDMFPKPQKK